MARALELAVPGIKKAAQAIFGDQVALMLIGPRYQEINAWSDYRRIVLGECGLLTDNWCQITVERE